MDKDLAELLLSVAIFLIAGVVALVKNVINRQRREKPSTPPRREGISHPVAELQRFLEEISREAQGMPPPPRPQPAESTSRPSEIIVLEPARSSQPVARASEADIRLAEAQARARAAKLQRAKARPVITKLGQPPAAGAVTTSPVTRPAPARRLPPRIEPPRPLETSVRLGREPLPKILETAQAKAERRKAEPAAPRHVAWMERLPKDPLKRAVVLAEILMGPVSLRRRSFHAGAV